MTKFRGANAILSPATPAQENLVKRPLAENSGTPAIPGVRTQVAGALAVFPRGIQRFLRAAGPEYCWDEVATAARHRLLAKRPRIRDSLRKTSKERLKTRFGAK